ELGIGSRYRETLPAQGRVLEEVVGVHEEQVAARQQPDVDRGDLIAGGLTPFELRAVEVAGDRGLRLRGERGAGIGQGRGGRCGTGDAKEFAAIHSANSFGLGKWR